MKYTGLICKTALFVFMMVLTIFLVLSYQTMYKQNTSIPILEYHHLTSDPGMVTTWTVNVNDFNDQMIYLSETCHIVPLKTILENIQQGNPVPDHTVAVTFDDGYQSNYLLAYPILEKYKIPATIFVIGKYTDNGTGGGFQAMVWDELKTMVASGLVDIGSHTYDLHRRVPNSLEGKDKPPALAHIITDKGTETQAEYTQRIENDLERSHQEIMTNLGTDPEILCWPFGAFDKNTTALAKKAGFVYMIGTNGYSNPSTDIENIKRVAIPGGMSLKKFEEVVNPTKVNYFQAMGLELERIKLKLIKVSRHG